MDNDLWYQFEHSGKITDYLRYKGYPGSSDLNADDIRQRNSNT